MASILDEIKEDLRQGITQDDRYYKNLAWVFRLVVDGESNVGPVGSDGTALFPLPISPDRFEYTLPFASQLTPQQESGVVVEPGGIVIADITIGGTTGFKLRKQQTVTVAPSLTKFTSSLGEYGGNLQEVSGQMAFWILANRCFEGYSQLVQDPKTADKTRMELHIQKEQIHVEVVPVHFRLSRDVGRERVTYRYDIALKVIGPASALIYVAPDERSLFQKIKDTISQIRDTIQSIKALVDDVTAALNELKQFVQNIASIIDDIGSIIQAADDLVNGVKDFFDLPARFLDAVSGVLESTADLFEDVLSLPADVCQTFRQLGDQMDSLGVATRDHFRASWSAMVDKYNRLSAPDDPAEIEIGSAQYQEQIEEKAATAAASGGAMPIGDAFGPIKPGDLKRQALPLPGDRFDPRRYTGFAERVVGQGDTLQSLAARYLGDARRWPELAMINDLKPPYITANANIPGTLKVGAPIMIPVTTANATSMVLSTGAVPLGDSQAEEHLGRELLLVKIGKGQYGWKVDAAHGSTDAEKISGFNNLAQALSTRLRTTRGENILYPGVGLPRLVGALQWKDTKADTAFEVRQQLIADPRVDQLVNYRLSVVNDEVELEATVKPKGFNAARVMSRALT
ncbi:MAG: hypothetical protein MUC88_00535 [Planctomycetes bacterium]|jgi:hypothetical protein|nr:hypothetical protein [Planctomycetota bacterium]